MHSMLASCSMLACRYVQVQYACIYSMLASCGGCCCVPRFNRGIVPTNVLVL